MLNFDIELNVRQKAFFGAVCLAFLEGKSCPYCAESKRLYRLADQQKSVQEAESLRDQARQFYARSRVFVNAINCHDESGEYKVSIYALPPTVYDDIILNLKGLKAMKEDPNIFHPVTGRNVVIQRKGQKPIVRYTVNIDSKSSPIPNKQVLEELKNGDTSSLHDLSLLPEIYASGSVPIYRIDSDLTVLRIMPPYNGKTIYKELKFHRVLHFDEPTPQSNTTTETPHDDVPFFPSDATKSEAPAVLNTDDKSEEAIDLDSILTNFLKE